MGVAAVVRLIGLVWLVLAGLSVGALVILNPSPHSVANDVVDNVVNFVSAVLILGGPGLLLVQIAADLPDHRQSSVGTVLLLTFSFVLFAGYGCFVLCRAFGPSP